MTMVMPQWCSQHQQPWLLRGSLLLNPLCQLTVLQMMMQVPLALLQGELVVAPSQLGYFLVLLIHHPVPQSLFFSVPPRPPPVLLLPLLAVLQQVPEVQGCQ
jgi:hypothetical protein